MQNWTVCLLFWFERTISYLEVRKIRSFQLTLTKVWGYIDTDFVNHKVWRLKLKISTFFFKVEL